MYQEGDIAGSIANLQGIRSGLELENRTLQSVLIDKKIEALDLAEAEISANNQSREAKKNFLKRSKARLRSSKKGKRGKYIVESGGSGIEVENMQKALKKINLYSGPIDGVYTEELKKAIIQFQKDNNLTADGVAGPLTMKKLGLY